MTSLIRFSIWLALPITATTTIHAPLQLAPLLRCAVIAFRRVVSDGNAPPVRNSCAFRMWDIRAERDETETSRTRMYECHLNTHISWMAADGPPVPAQVCEGLRFVASLDRRQDVREGCRKRAAVPPSAENAIMERMKIERLTLSMQRAAPAVPRSAAGCRRRGFSGWRPRPSSLSESEKL